MTRAGGASSTPTEGAAWVAGAALTWWLLSAALDRAVWRVARPTGALLWGAAVVALVPAATVLVLASRERKRQRSEGTGGRVGPVRPGAAALLGGCLFSLWSLPMLGDHGAAGLAFHLCPPWIGACLTALGWRLATTTRRPAAAHPTTLAFVGSALRSRLVLRAVVGAAVALPLGAWGWRWYGPTPHSTARRFLRAIERRDPDAMWHLYLDSRTQDYYSVPALPPMENHRELAERLLFSRLPRPVGCDFGPFRFGLSLPGGPMTSVFFRSASSGRWVRGHWAPAASSSPWRERAAGALTIRWSGWRQGWRVRADSFYLSFARSIAGGRPSGGWEAYEAWVRAGGGRLAPWKESAYAQRVPPRSSPAP